MKKTASETELIDAATKVLEWYDRDGSVGGIADPIDRLRQSTARASLQKLDKSDPRHPIWALARLVAVCSVAICLLWLNYDSFVPSKDIKTAVGTALSLFIVSAIRGLSAQFSGSSNSSQP